MQTREIIIQDFRERLIIPEFSNGDMIVFYNKNKIEVAYGYERIVIGNYGPFAEFNEEMIFKNNIYIPKSQEWRLQNDNKSCFYNEWRTNDNLTKIYNWKHVVEYADYKIGKWYILISDLMTDKFENLLKKKTKIHSGSKKEDYVGFKFNHFTVIKLIETKNNKRFWLCQCDCGNEKIYSTSDLRPDRVFSCGLCITRDSRRLNPMVAAKNRLIAIYKKHARQHDRIFSLIDEQFFNLTQQSCHYCGTEPNNSTETIAPSAFGHFKYNGIDRKDNEIGYTLENCLTSCRKCNLAKNTMTYDEFINWIKTLINFRRDL